MYELMDDSELDAAVAREVMGWKLDETLMRTNRIVWHEHYSSECIPQGASSIYKIHNDWHPSFDLRAALKALDKFNEWTIDFDRTERLPYTVAIINPVNGEFLGMCHSKTMPDAACRAALEAVSHGIIDKVIS
ncbi:hypothetical protein LCGC14_1674840 [marine sediment metagenome]|uniref:Phage ABA sandwich domain-containing protein n=1 Tax=marine sediment metagenome TaxID=412755 RepID=A0A0F9HQE2_9ZZZZ